MTVTRPGNAAGQSDKRMDQMMDINKLAGGSLVALAVALTAGAAVADRGARMGGMGMPMQALDFAAVDTDADGKISPVELTAWRAAQAQAVDTDGDGLISVEELAAMHLRAATERATEHATRMMAARDTDGDGKLSASEMALGPVPARLFERLDTDGDDAISEAELTAARDRMAEHRGGRGHGHERGEGRGEGRREGRGPYGGQDDN